MMKTTEYRKFLAKFGLSIVGAAPVLGVSRRHAQRFAAGAVIPPPIEKLIHMLMKHGLEEDDG